MYLFMYKYIICVYIYSLVHNVLILQSGEMQYDHSDSYHLWCFQWLTRGNRESDTRTTYTQQKMSDNRIQETILEILILCFYEIRDKLLITHLYINI